MRCQSAEDDRVPTRATVAWIKDEVSVSTTVERRIEDDGSLCIDNAVITDAGNYTCYMLGEPYPHELSVIGGIIVEPPACGSSDKGELIGVGRDTAYIDASTVAIQVCCRVQGPSETTVTWLLDEAPIEKGSRDYTFTENRLRYTGRLTLGCFTYTCQANLSAILPLARESARICVGTNSPPSVVTITGEKSVMEHDSTSYHCSSDGFPVPMIVWTTDGDDESLLPQNATDHGNGTLTLADVTESDGRHKFCCNVGNDYGNRHSCMNINVLLPPEIDRLSLLYPTLVVSVPFGAILPLQFPQNITVDVGQDIMIPQTYNLMIECPIYRANPSPSISWLHGNRTIPGRYSQYSVQADGTLVVKAVERGRDDGVYTCIADSPGVGQDESSSTVTVTVPPQIKTSDLVSSPGNCLDLTQEQQNATQQIGVDLCVKAAQGTTLTLGCGVLQGVPPPDTHWLRDGEHLASTLPSEVYENTTERLILTLPLDASHSSKQAIEGNYSCVATNEAGIAVASTFVTLFGDIPIQSAITEFVIKQSDLYHQLHQTLSEHFPGVRDSKQHLTFLTSGKVLPYEDFDPGYLYDESEESVLPQTMENMFDLVDVIPNGGSIVFNPYEAPRLQETYSELVNMLQVAPSSLSPDKQREIRSYLLEMVKDIGSSSNVSIPRLSVYLLYKNTYYMTVLEIDELVESQRQRLFDWEFMQWYEHNLHILNNRKQEALTKWKIFANKEDVEEKLDLLKLTDHSQEIYNAKVLLVTNRRKSRFKDEKVYYLVRLYPENWYKKLQNKLKESIYQMQFQLTRLKSQIKLLEITSQYLEKESKKREILNSLFPSLDPINKLYCDLDTATFELEQIVKDSEDLRYECLVSGNPADCHLYWSLQEYIREEVVTNYTEFYWYVHTVEAALNHRQYSIPAIASTITDMEIKIHHIQTSINIALSELAERDYEEEQNNDRDFLSEFNFRPHSMESDYNFELPTSITGRLLWYINSESTPLLPGELLQEYNLTFNHLNTAATNVSAKVTTVNIHRRWLKAGLFENQHLGLKNPDIIVSPGVTSDFSGTIRNGTYSLPLYPTSLLLATDIELTVDVPFIFHTLPTLIKLSYDPHVTGGFGPFSFGPLHRAKAGDMKFKVDIRDNKISITLPGTQLIGYVCDVVPQHPRETVLRSRRSTDFASKTSKSDFDDWLFSKRRNSLIPNDPSHHDADEVETPEIFLSGKMSEGEEIKQLKLLIAPTHPADNQLSGNVGVSTQYSFSTNNSVGPVTKTSS
jgi:hypothetical protein